MSKNGDVTGSRYRACPCARITEKIDSGVVYFSATCCSPKRDGEVRINSTAQNRICCGGQVNGQRYTGCQYYVRNAKISGSRHTVTRTGRSLVPRLVWAGLFWIIAYALSNSDVQYSGAAAIIFLLIGCWFMFAGLFSKTGVVRTGSGRKRERKK